MENDKVVGLITRNGIARDVCRLWANNLLTFFQDRKSPLRRDLGVELSR